MKYLVGLAMGVVGAALAFGCGGDSHVEGGGSSGSGAGASGSSGSGATGGSSTTGGVGGTSGGRAGSGATSGGTGGASAGGAMSGGTGGTTAGAPATGGASGTSGTGGSTGGAQGGDAGVAGDGGSGAAPFACSASRSCVLVPDNCCGYCGDTSISEWTAVPDEEWQAYNASHCGSAVGCPDCITRSFPYYAAVCRDGECTAVDLRDDELSACNDNSDCRLRWGAGCCEGCTEGSPDDLVALSTSADLADAFCGTLLPPCCGPAGYPSNASAVCDDGHCAVQIVP